VPTHVATGITPLPDGDEVHWSREEGGPEAAALGRRHAAARRYRLTTLNERDGAFSVYHGEVPGAWLHAFPPEWEDRTGGEGKAQLSVRAGEKR